MDTKSILALASLMLSLAAYGKQNECYRVTHTFDDTLSPREMNNKGELVGSRHTSEISDLAFFWRDGEFVDLPPPLDASFTAVTGINDRSDIVGVYTGEQGFRAVFLRRNGELAEIPGLSGGVQTVAVDINNRRQILANSITESFAYRPFVWKRGKVTVLGLLPGVDGGAFASDINDRGVAVGGAGREFAMIPVMWDVDGSVMPLPLPPGATSGRGGTSINNKGQVLAHAQFGSGPDSFLQAYIWDEGEIKMLGLLPDAKDAVASSMNAQAVAVGSMISNNSNVGQFATVWRRGQPAELDTLICADDPFHSLLQLIQAVTINNRGQIVAWGLDESIFDVRYFLLDPSRP